MSVSKDDLSMLPPLLLSGIQRDLDCALDFCGSLDRPERTRCALLVSRAERSPNPDAPWLRASLDAAVKIVNDGGILVCGAGRLVWDCALLTCRHSNGSALVVLEQRPTSGELSALREFTPLQTLFAWPSNLSEKSEQKLLRDRLVGCLANHALAIHIRSNGNMASVADSMRARGCAVEPFISQAPKECRMATLPAQTPGRVKFVAPAELENRLTHFTREPDGNWPGETRAEYLNWLCSGNLFEPRDGFHALIRILLQRKIQSCGRLIPGKVPVVCFTAATPQSVLDRARYRKGLRRWTLSPYALSLPRSAFANLYARPVHYLASAERPNDDDACFTQPADSNGIHWEHEDEWRLRGDFAFSALPANDMIALVPTISEAEILAREFGVRVGLLNSQQVPV